MEATRLPLAVTGVRVVDLFAPFPIGGSLAVAGDHRSGVNVVSMEVMQNLCRRYDANATCTRIRTAGAKRAECCLLFGSFGAKQSEKGPQAGRS